MFIFLFFFLQQMPLGNIAQDAARFKRLIKGYIKNKEHLKKYISREELLTKGRDETIRIPVPVIKIPRFKYGINIGGVGQGDGEVGDAIDPYQSGNPDSGAGDRSLRNREIMDLELEMSELEEIVMEELKLPFLEPKGNHVIHTQKPNYNSIAEQGVQRNFKRTYKEALKRMAASGNYKPGEAVVPVNRGFRYRTATNQPDKQSAALLVYMLDVSGSMDQDKRRLCRLTNFWLQRIIGRYYKHLEEKFIVHTDQAYLVEGPVFYGTKLEGITYASSAFEKSAEIIKTEYPAEDWNIYCFYYSDGENYSSDNDPALKVLKEDLLPKINMFCYGECSADKDLFKSKIKKEFGLNSKKENHFQKRIRTSTLLEDKDILETLRTFLNKNETPFYLI